MKDAYAKAVDYFVNNPRRITRAWFSGYCRGETLKPGGFLFRGLGPTGSSEIPCPIGIRMCQPGFARKVLHPELHGLITDDRVPTDEADLDKDGLKAIAEWQRKADKIYKRPEPVFT